MKREFLKNLAQAGYGDLEVNQIFKETVGLVAGNSLIFKWADVDKNNPVIPREKKALTILKKPKLWLSGTYSLHNEREYLLKDYIPGMRLNMMKNYYHFAFQNLDKLEQLIHTHHEQGISGLDICSINVLHTPSGFQLFDYGTALFSDTGTSYSASFQKERLEDYRDLYAMAFLKDYTASFRNAEEYALLQVKKRPLQLF